ncbi:MAG: hypothetical protein ABJ092_12830 [Gillisia sp.]
MKKLLLILGFIICTASGFSMPDLSTKVIERNFKNVAYSLENYTIIENEFSCTVSFKVYIPTASGIYGVGMSITADTCEEANQGMMEAVKGFISEI